MVYHKKSLQFLGPCPHNIKAVLWQCSPVLPPRYPDGTSTKSTEFCSSTGDSYTKITAYNTYLEPRELASSNIEFQVQDPGVCL